MGGEVPEMTTFTTEDRIAMQSSMNANKPVAELVLEQMAVGDASSLRVKWLMDGYPPVGTKLYTRPVDAVNISKEYIDKTKNNRHELTDEEMMKAEYEFLTWNRSLNNRLVEIAYELPVFQKVVAILRKAQEK